MAFTPLSDLLKKGAKKRGIGKQVEASMALEYFSKTIEILFSKNVLSAIRPLYVREGVLVVAVLSPVIGTELKLREATIVSEINKKFGYDVVRSLRFLS